MKSSLQKFFRNPSLGTMVEEYINNSRQLCLQNLNPGLEQEVTEEEMKVDFEAICELVNDTNPVDIRSVYTKLMEDGIKRFKQVDSLLTDGSVLDCSLWNAENNAFLELFPKIQKRRYDYNNATFSDNGEVSLTPIEMIEEISDMTAHNCMVKMSADNYHDYMTSLDYMNSCLKQSYSDMTPANLDSFVNDVNAKEQDYQSSLKKYTEYVEYFEDYDFNTDFRILKGVTITINKLHNYCRDMVRKYKNALSYAENIDKHVENAIEDTIVLGQSN